MRTIIGGGCMSSQLGVGVGGWVGSGQAVRERDVKDEGRFDKNVCVGTWSLRR